MLFKYFPILLIIFFTSCETGSVTTIHDTVRITKHDTVKIIKHDTIVINKHDTIYKTRYDTIYKTKYDTVVISKHDTTIITNTKIIHDTIIKKITVHDTLFKTRIDTVFKFLHDTVRIIKHDSVFIKIHDTIRIRIPVHDTIYIDTSRRSTFGFMQEGVGGNDLERLADSVGLKLLRNNIFFSDRTNKKAIDDMLNHGYNVQINYNYKSTDVPVVFPTDTVFIRKQAETFFAYYKPYIKQIPFVVCENEWDNDHYRDWNHTQLSDYLTELSIVTDVAHKYGFKIADAGITSHSLVRWYYSQLPADKAKIWKSHYFIDEYNSDYKPMLELVNQFITAIQNIPVDYLNVHWYNLDTCFSGFAAASSTYKYLCKKDAMISNEFGTRLGKSTDKQRVWYCTLAEIKAARMPFCIMYSGRDMAGFAMQLTVQMLQELR